MTVVAFVCTGRGTHRERRLARADPADDSLRTGIFVNRDTMNYTLPPCPVHTCGKHVTLREETWVRIRNAGLTKVDISYLPF